MSEPCESLQFPREGDLVKMPCGPTGANTSAANPALDFSSNFKTSEPCESLRLVNPTTYYPLVILGENQEELLKIGSRGEFYVRGKLVPQDESEAQAVYEATVRWLKLRAYPLIPIQKVTP